MPHFLENITLQFTTPHVLAHLLLLVLLPMAAKPATTKILYELPQAVRDQEKRPV
ncbi:MAG TPA: hypothetical protein VK140_03810 [Ktedonobacteraceae bacterium]|nr:hypothetical protein [Ktedonobacteraceae bacterium]